MKAEVILKEVLKNYVPSNEEVLKIKKLADFYVNKLKKEKLNVFIGGSLAKDTLVKKDIQDVDIFVLFDKEENTLRLESSLKKLKLDFKKVHGSRDYFQIKDEEILFEIIPVVKVEKPETAGNVTDFSLIHVNYIKKKIAKNKKLADEIRLAKIFCYAQNCYGAESYIQGFSGYSLELLICYFGSFMKFLKGIQKKRIIDSEKFFKNDKKILSELNESKLLAPVILIDPTYKYRNVCAGLSKETFERFLEFSKKFIAKPSLNFFEKKKIDIESIKALAKKKKGKYFELFFSTEKQEGDIAGTKMRKFFEFIISELERKGQKVLFKEFNYSGEKIAEAHLIINEKKEVEIKGPPVANKKALTGFRKARKKIYFKNGFAFTKEKINVKDIILFVKRFEEEMGVRLENFN
ncbi:MAG: nucleotidyltransferase domain-containing protein [Nanoarchaeota archaeon]|nr:nucleotidyltransferase domain-containing protein [Nanoarchaeota archaeon]